MRTLTFVILLAVHPVLANDVSKAQRLYALNDQHDTLALQLQDALTERGVNAVELAARRVQWEKIQDAAAHGSIPEKTMLDLEMQLQLDELSAGELDGKVTGLKAKLRAVEALRDGDILGFARGDRDTNAAQLTSAEFAVKKADVVAKRAQVVFEHLDDLMKDGSGSWAVFHAARTAKSTTREMLDGAHRRRAEQATQLEASQHELDELEKHPPVTPPRG